MIIDASLFMNCLSEQVMDDYDYINPWLVSLLEICPAFEMNELRLNIFKIVSRKEKKRKAVVAKYVLK